MSNLAHMSVCVCVTVYAGIHVCVCVCELFCVYPRIRSSVGFPPLRANLNPCHSLSVRLLYPLSQLHAPPVPLPFPEVEGSAFERPSDSLPLVKLHGSAYHDYWAQTGVEAAGGTLFRLTPSRISPIPVLPHPSPYTLGPHWPPSYTAHPFFKKQSPL